MQADMHDLFPAIGDVNAKHSNYHFTVLLAVKLELGNGNMRNDSHFSHEQIHGKLI